MGPIRAAILELNGSSTATSVAGARDLRSTPRRAYMVGGMSIAKDDIRTEWDLGDPLVVKMEGDDGDGTDGDGTDGDGDGDGTDGTDGDGTDG